MSDYLCPRSRWAVTLQEARRLVDIGVNPEKCRCKFVGFTTPLHHYCAHGNLLVAKYLIEERKIDPNRWDSEGLSSLHYACAHGRMEVIKYLIDTGHCVPDCADRCGLTPLHYAINYACEHGNGEMAEYLIETCHCDPNCADRCGSTPLHYACRNKHTQVIKYLLDKERCDPHRKDGNGKSPLHYAIESGIWPLVQYLVEKRHCDPNCTDFNLKTPLCYVCEHGPRHGHMEIVKYLIDTVQCDPKCVDQYGSTPLHYALGNGHMDVAKYLIETGHCDLGAFDRDGKTPLHLVISNIQFFKYLVESCSCNPECADSHGWTPLHHASKLGYNEMVRYLLVECHCNPNCKTGDGRTPLDLAVNFPAVARELVTGGAEANTKPPQLPVKIFIVGNPSAGKSSLTRTLQTEASALGAAVGSIFGSQLVQGVEPQTAGIIPCRFTSKHYGHVIFYDLAGHQEYYASHAALIQNSISSSTPLFIIVVNLCDSEEDIKQKLVYWISLLANQCISLTVDPHVIIVGSHKDVVKSKGEDPKAKVDLEFLQKVCVSSGFVLFNFIPMDCRQSNSRSITKLAESMKKSCDALREEVIATHHSYHLFTYLLEEFKETPAVTFEEVLQSASSSTFMKFRLSTHNLDYLNSSCVALNDSGHIIYLRHRADITKSWIILNPAAIFSEVNGILFAPKGFKQHYDLAIGTTGMVPLSRLVSCFPRHNPDMLVQLLCHLQFCCEIHDHEILHQLSPQSEIKEPPLSERYFFFPGLISTDSPSSVWEEKPHFSQFCGWMLQCRDDTHLLTPQFLQVVLLRLAFSCALDSDDFEGEDHPVLTTMCSIWKSGIYWGTHNGVEALVEVRTPPQNKQVVVMLRCVSGHEVDCAHLRSTIIKTVLEAKRKLCSKVPTEEFFLQPSQVRVYPFQTPAKEDLLSIREASRAILKGGSSVVDFTGRSFILNDVLLFEPYAHLGKDILNKLFSGETVTITDRFIYTVADRIYKKKERFISMLRLSRAQLADKIRQALGGDIEEFVCVLQCWRGDSGTYQSLRETLDQFSVFAGRNPLVSCYTACQS